MDSNPITSRKTQKYQTHTRLQVIKRHDEEITRWPADHLMLIINIWTYAFTGICQVIDAQANIWCKWDTKKCLVNLFGTHVDILFNSATTALVNILCVSRTRAKYNGPTDHPCLSALPLCKGLPASQNKSHQGGEGQGQWIVTTFFPSPNIHMTPPKKPLWFAHRQDFWHKCWQLLLFWTFFKTGCRRHSQAFPSKWLLFKLKWESQRLQVSQKYSIIPYTI